MMCRLHIFVSSYQSSRKENKLISCPYQADQETEEKKFETNRKKMREQNKEQKNK